jgi:hypothetical protein
MLYSAEKELTNGIRNFVGTFFLFCRLIHDDGCKLAVADVKTNGKDAKQIQNLRLSEIHAKN